MSVMKSKRLMLFREIINFVCEDDRQHFNRPKASRQNPEFLTTHIVTTRIKRLNRVLHVFRLNISTQAANDDRKVFSFLSFPFLFLLFLSFFFC